MIKSDKNRWLVYVLKCRNYWLYIGITNNIEKRLRDHERGVGSKFVWSRRPFELIKTIPCKSQTEARRLEAKLKKMDRKGKIRELKLDI
jgi:putative endonuclease